VNGVPVDVVPTHHALQGVPIPAGDSTVELRYDPLPLRAGLWISGGASLVMIGMLALAWWTRGHNSWPWCGTLGSLRPARRKDLCAGPQSVYTEQPNIGP
jgi:hypothetical protein